MSSLSRHSFPPHFFLSWSGDRRALHSFPTRRSSDLITVFCSLRLRDSRLGRAWIAIREDETAAAAMGVPLMRTKTWAYATGAFFGGVAGAYFASFKSSTFPNDFNFNISAFILSMVILGGMCNVCGVMFCASFIAFLNKVLLLHLGN